MNIRQFLKDYAGFSLLLKIKNLEVVDIEVKKNESERDKEMVGQ